ncbi:hypothetical protein VULLAG_LOCUS17681 [Vulpes lagopus]
MIEEARVGSIAEGGLMFCRTLQMELKSPPSSFPVPSPILSRVDCQCKATCIPPADVPVSYYVDRHP